MMEVRPAAEVYLCRLVAGRSFPGEVVVLVQ